ncbi:hypothetical protein [Lactobacillus agrestimuris]|uniref:hypothetical protein n=1 Tax=Lactobacillus agrestimuris TaxID=2941328 RepID=UPI002044AC58|nr:hypothetical protein [Lactobacillus agrestimuris]
MYDEKELEYTLYLIKTVLRDCIDKLDISSNREAFLLYYGISAKQSEKIEKLFWDIVNQENNISFSEFSQMLNQRLESNFSSQVIKKLLDAYKEYEPVAISKIK